MPQLWSKIDNRNGHPHRRPASCGLGRGSHGHSAGFCSTYCGFTFSAARILRASRYTNPTDTAGNRQRGHSDHVFRRHFGYRRRAKFIGVIWVS
ncbi:hypothetical protein LJC49_05400 [Ruminococcaceae bacterium OttesenSCG-928-I18]|nr:hypothetical protein [Ruminococcaceae bacterium OttesenSCG-928-I18]